MINFIFYLRVYLKRTFLHYFYTSIYDKNINLVDIYNIYVVRYSCSKNTINKYCFCITRVYHLNTRFIISIYHSVCQYNYIFCVIFYILFYQCSNRIIFELRF